MSRSEPLLTRAGVVTAIAVLSAVCVKLGAADVASWLNGYADNIADVVLAAAPLVAAALARRHVTPVAAPRGNAGVPLVPADSAPAPASATAAIAVAEAIYPIGQ